MRLVHTRITIRNSDPHFALSHESEKATLYTIGSMARRLIAVKSDLINT